MCVNFNDCVIISGQLHYDWDNKITVTRLNHILLSPTIPLIIYRSYFDLDHSTPNAMKRMSSCYSDTIHVIVTAIQNLCFSWWLYRRVNWTSYETSV